MPLVGGIYDDFINACPYVTKVGTGDGGRVDAEKLCREACRNPPLRAAMVAHYTARLKRRKEEGFNPSGRGIRIADAPLSGAWHVLWGPTETPWGRAEGCNM